MKKPAKTIIKNILADFFSFVIGSIIFAVSVSAFTAPNNIAPGGVTGIATVLNHLFDVRIGTAIIILNTPLIIAAFFIIGWRFVTRSLICLVVSSVMIDTIAIELPRLQYTSNPLLAAVAGGVLSGVGLSLIYMRGGSTGGTDVAARILNKYKPHLKLGSAIMIFDMAVVACATAVYKDVELALLAVITIFLASVVIDKVMDGLDMGKLMFIVTNSPSEVGKAIMTKMDRGATLLKGEGAYSGEEKKILMCAVRRNESFRLKQIVHDIDPYAFIMVGDASHIYGEGFRPMKEEDK